MVIAVADVERWVQPDLIEKKAVGEAVVAFVGPGSASVSGSAAAAVVLAVKFPVAVATAGAATAVLVAPDTFAPLVRAPAVVAIESDARTDDYHAASAIALLPITSVSVSQVALSAVALFEVFSRFPQAVEVVGDAEVSFGDFGMDVPIFPMQFPFQFTASELLRWASATVTIGGVGSVDAVAVTGTATVRIAGKAKLNFQGSIPVFPFGFPAVFDNEAFVRLGSAVVAPGEQPFPTAVEVLAEAVANIYTASFALHQTIFAFQFPAIFDSSGYARADAIVELVSDCSAVVVLDADAVVDVSTSMSVDSSAVFPWEFGVIFQ